MYATSVRRIYTSRRHTERRVQCCWARCAHLGQSWHFVSSCFLQRPSIFEALVVVCQSLTCGLKVLSFICQDRQSCSMSEPRSTSGGRSNCRGIHAMHMQRRTTIPCRSRTDCAVSAHCTQAHIIHEVGASWQQSCPVHDVAQRQR